MNTKGHEAEKSQAEWELRIRDHPLVNLGVAENEPTTTGLDSREFAFIGGGICTNFAAKNARNSKRSILSLRSLCSVRRSTWVAASAALGALAVEPGCSGHASSASTALPAMPVSRTSSPWNLIESRVCSMPSSFSIVACRSWTSIGFSTAEYPNSSVAP